MPSQKRTRKRAARQARLAALQQQQRRRSTLRRTVVIVVLVAAAVGIYLAVKPSSKPTAAKSSTTTVPNPVGFTPAVTTTTTSVSGETTSANCPTPFTATTALHKPSWSSPPPMIIDTSKAYDAKIATDVGTFVISLDVSAAPKTVNNFVFLAENHFFDCVVFHRVIPGFMDQTGDPTGTGTGGPGYQFDNENVPSSYTTGQVAMANSGPNTNGSQFFVLVAPYSNTGYSLFGSVVSGQSVVDKINNDGSSSGTPNKLHRMISVEVLES